MTKPRKKSVRHSLGVKVEALRLLKGGSHVSTVAERYNVCRSAVLRWAAAAGMKTFPAKFRKRSKVENQPAWPSWLSQEGETVTTGQITLPSVDPKFTPDPPGSGYHPVRDAEHLMIPPVGGTKVIPPAPAPKVYAYCPWCGHDLRDNSGFRFCPWCSHAI